eukprot:scaffold140_cov247-Pinguiococcus_pyrenoidosus.AAC.9
MHLRWIHFNGMMKGGERRFIQRPVRALASRGRGRLFAAPWATRLRGLRLSTPLPLPLPLSLPLSLPLFLSLIFLLLIEEQSGLRVPHDAAPNDFPPRANHRHLRIVAEDPRPHAPRVEIRRVVPAVVHDEAAEIVQPVASGRALRNPAHAALLHVHDVLGGGEDPVDVDVPCDGLHHLLDLLLRRILLRPDTGDANHGRRLDHVATHEADSVASRGLQMLRHDALLGHPVVIVQGRARPPVALVGNRIREGPGQRHADAPGFGRRGELEDLVHVHPEEELVRGHGLRRRVAFLADPMLDQLEAHGGVRDALGAARLVLQVRRREAMALAADLNHVNVNQDGLQRLRGVAHLAHVKAPLAGVQLRERLAQPVRGQHLAIAVGVVTEQLAKRPEERVAVRL